MNLRGDNDAQEGGVEEDFNQEHATGSGGRDSALQTPGAPVETVTSICLVYLD